MAGNPNLIRRNGQHVVIDAPDPTENIFGDEFNGDVSTIAAQGTVTYTYASQLPFANIHPLPARMAGVSCCGAGRNGDACHAATRYR